MTYWVNSFVRNSFYLFALLILASSLHADEQETQDQPKSHIQAGIDALNLEDFEAASNNFAEGFDTGEVDGAFYLGRMLELGLGGPANLKAAIGLYIAGSEQGSAPAKNRLGVLHVQGKGVLQDYQKGAELICEAATLGDMNGAFNCASLTMEGRGVDKDETVALSWYEQAAELGHIGAKNAFANALVEGKFIERDIDEAVALFEETAAAGNPDGFFSLGQAYAAGIGVTRDLIKAHGFFNLAAALEHPEAGLAREAIELEMSPDEVTEAQAYAKTWRPQETRVE